MHDEQLYRSAYSALRAGKYALAKRAFSELAAGGSPAAWISLGWMYEHGRGVEKSDSEAEACYGKAIALGYSLGNFYLARLLVGQEDFPRAFTHFVAAADAGHVPSLYWLGRLYLTGRGVDQDVSKAEQYLTEAMHRGHVYARRDFYRYRLRGVFGKRRMSDLFGWVATMISGIALVVRDPYSELLQ